VVGSWGALAERLSSGENLLEVDDRGPDTTWEIWDDAEAAIVGGAYGEFMDIVEVCDCGKFLVEKPHQCEYSERCGVCGCLLEDHNDDACEQAIRADISYKREDKP
jgi:hypothetical protein